MTKLQSMTYKILNLMKTLPLFILISLYILFSLMHHKSCRTSHELLSHQQLKYLPQAALKQHKSIFPFWIRQIMQKSEICPGITRTLKWQHKYWTITKPSRDGVKKDWGESGPGSAGLQWGCTHPKSAAIWGGQSVLQDLFMFEANMSWTAWKAARLTYRDYPCW